MLDENKHIDSLFADGLKGMSVEPKPEVWSAISKSMAAGRRKKRGIIIFISAALAASVLLFFVIANSSLFVSDYDDLEWQQISDNSSMANQDNKKKNVFADTKDEIPESRIKETNVIASDESIIPKKVSINMPIENTRTFQKEKLIKSIPSCWRKLSISKYLIPESLKFKHSKKTDPIRQTSEELIVANNLLQMEQTAKKDLKNNRWAIIGQLSSEYSNEESAESANSGIVSLGGGVKVDYALGKKLSLQIGFMYNRFGQDLGGNNRVLAFSNSNALEGEAIDDIYSSAGMFPVNTSAGNIKYKSVDQNSNSEFMLTAFNDSSEELMQSFETIEVPFLLRYSLSQKRLGVYVNGGFGANWILTNGVYSTSGSKRKIGEIQNIRTANFSSLLGLGFEYQLSPKVYIGFEPSFKYYLNSINKSSKFNYKPYSIGVHTGIRYNF